MPSRPDTLLRPAAPGDAAALSRLRYYPALQHLLMANPDPVPPADPVAEAAVWMARREGEGWFRVIDAGTGALGFVQISDIHRKNRFGWLGLALLPDARGRGLGSCALSETERLAATELGLRKLLLQVRVDNAAAIAVYDRAGWRRVGILQAHYDDGTHFHDALICEKPLA